MLTTLRMFKRSLHDLKLVQVHRRATVDDAEDVMGHCGLY